jgi:hypothetical protein
MRLDFVQSWFRSNANDDEDDDADDDDDDADDDDDLLQPAYISFMPITRSASNMNKDCFK